MEKNNEESSVSQRDEKNKKVRGTMTYHTNGDAEFSAQKEGAPFYFIISYFIISLSFFDFVRWNVVME